MSKKEKPQTELVDINSVIENESNPRFIKDDKFKKLVKSIKDFPQMLELRPIIVDEDMIALGGNMRLRACKELGLKEVPIIQVKGLTEKQKSEFIIKDNVGFGEWDWDKLANEWESDMLKEWGVDLPNFGDEYFDTEEAKADDSRPSASSDDYSTFELIMLHENKLLFLEVLNSIKQEYLFEKQEEALMELVRQYKLNIKK